ncbi:MAG: cell division protein SepF, partial [Eggerthellaceae bacterium]|nr:cell division protein SepF [Eggerthellaceae bacterium]
ARDGAAQERPSFETGSGAPAGGYDPYRVYEAGSASSHRPSRSVSVISPVAYSEVENVARMLRAGDAVVLSLRNTPNQLSKRILDFSFGVASALDATVDCIADKVFAITRVSGLDDDELSRLRSQGVI